ncbi:MAG: NADH-quinone oxidoreductase subunit M [Deltaproteobacteria bacterium]|nr:NADH-quinone oxidoreductase subunit M [Deltaproteobacteria bacterium]
MAGLLTAVVFLPLVGAGVLLFADRAREQTLRQTALGASALTFLLSLPLYFRFDAGLAGMQFVERAPWIPQWGIAYHLGVDGISLFLVLLTTFLTPLALLASWSAITARVKEFLICMLLLETGMLGVFAALDLFLFYIFWEAMLVPMYFLIGVWGGPQRIYAAVKFLLYTMAGSLLMLVGLLALYFLTGARSFDLLELYRAPVPAAAQTWLFLAFFLAFAFKVPMFPFHTWLPDAHVEAPTAGSVLLAAVLLKMGTYGFLRFSLPLFPVAAEALTPLIAVLALIGILYGALVAMVQPDVKSLVAYSSVSHLGFVVLGLFALNPQGLQGGLLQMLNHGLSTGALFLLVGILYERRHTRLIEEFGGLSRVMPAFAAAFLIVTLSSIGLPGLNGFVGEFLILLGAFRQNPTYGVLAALGVILSAIYMLWMSQRVMFGEVTNPANRALPDLTGREWAVLLPIILAIFWLGLYPQAVLRRIEPSVARLIQQVEEGRARAAALEPQTPPRLVSEADAGPKLVTGAQDRRP